LDQLRELRFLVPPFFFFASLSLGAYLDPCFSLVSQLSKIKDVQTLVIAAVGASTIPIGFLISVISIVVMTVLFKLFRKQWDIPYSSDSVTKIWAALNVPRCGRSDLQAVSTFDRTVVPEKVSDWILRRWTTFLVSAHSIVALLLAHAAAHLFTSIHQTCLWCITTAAICFFLFFHAATAWKDTREMGHLQAEIASHKPSPRSQ